MLERFGLINSILNKAPGAKRIWIHALSVGEIKSALPLVNSIQNKLEIPTSKHQASSKLQTSLSLQTSSEQETDSGNHPCCELIITASTQAGFNMAQEIFIKSDSQLIQSKFIQVGYFPFDLFFSIASISSRIDPDLVIIVESDLWPGFLWHMHKKKIPVFLVNGRLSKSSLEGYALLRRLFASVFCLFETIMVQTDNDKAGFLKIGVPEQKIKVTGNIKFDQPIPEIKQIENLEHLKADFSGRFLIAGSTHPGEEEILLSVFKKLREDIGLKQRSEFDEIKLSEFDEIKLSGFDDLKLIVVPRDPQRSIKIKKMFIAEGVNCQLASSCDFPCSFQWLSDSMNDVIIVDRIGILAALYAICDIAFVGGSLVPFGGHNPLEPALFAKPVVFGPYMDDFKEVSDTLLVNGAAFMVKDSNDMLETLKMLLDDEDLISKTGNNAVRLLEDGRGAVERILSIIFSK
ncbi:MAG: 3-deoxy-D-manno-octulosonic acid transferase [Desulfamplus sp.]|nr:3-deoxy-D-manno-octulosonic acid transferase [Desulfamplus sp.]